MLGVGNKSSSEEYCSLTGMGSGISWSTYRNIKVLCNLHQQAKVVKKEYYDEFWGGIKAQF